MTANIAHRPILDTAKVCEHYTAKDGVEVKYICTSALGGEAQAMDIYYRATPHPEFGNRYFGLYFRSTGPLDEQRQLCITNADRIEELEFGMKKLMGNGITVNTVTIFTLWVMYHLMVVVHTFVVLEM